MDSAMASARTLPRTDAGLLLIEEMTGPLGIPDLTAVVGDPNLLAGRLASGIPPLLNEIDAGIVAALNPRRGSSSDQVAARLGWSEPTVRRRTARLHTIGAVARTPSGNLVRHPAIQPVGRLYAIEAKLREWRRALRQARSYGAWADSYVLVMGPLGSAPLAELTASVQRDRAGLMVDGRRICTPRLHPLPNARRLWAAEHVVAAMSGYHPSDLP